MIRSNILTLTDIAHQNRLKKEDEAVEKFLANNERFEFQKKAPHQKLEIILAEVERVFNIEREELGKPGRSHHRNYIRGIYYSVAVRLSGSASKAIVLKLSKRDRSAVSHSVQNVTTWIKQPETNPQFHVYWQLWEQNAKPFLIPDIKREPWNKTWPAPRKLKDENE